VRPHHRLSLIRQKWPLLPLLPPVPEAAVLLKSYNSHPRKILFP